MEIYLKYIIPNCSNSEQKIKRFKILEELQEMAKKYPHFNIKAEIFLG